MAISYKEINNKLKSAPLTEEELRLIQEVEDYIDSEIIDQFPNSIYKQVEIDLNYAVFNYSHKTKSMIISNAYRRQLMRTELEKRYNAAGWRISIKIGDDSDGPNFAGPDLWVLQGK